MPAHVVVTHGSILKIEGALPGNAASVLRRAGASDRDGAWWCLPYEWNRIRGALRALGVTIAEEGEPEPEAIPAVPLEPVGPKQVLLSLEDGRIRIQGSLPKPMRKDWLGSDRRSGHVGMTPWAIPDFLQACREQHIEVTTDPSFDGLHKQVQERMLAVEHALTTKDLPDVPLATGTLRDYQRRAIQFLQACDGRALIGADVGVGKTIEAIGYKRAAGAQRILVVCPSTVKGNWADEVRKFDDSASTILDGFPRNYRDTPVFRTPWVITGFDTLLGGKGDRIGWLESFKAWKPDLVVVDESHYVKNRDSLRGKAIAALAAAVPHIPLMSGTLMSNSPMDYWNQLNAIQPGYWGTWFEFGLAWCNAQERTRYFGKGQKTTFWDTSGSSNPESLKRYMRYARILQPKQEVAPELPEQIRIPRTMELLPGFRLEYEAVQKEHREMMAKLRGTADEPNLDDPSSDNAFMASQRGKVMAMMLRLRQISGKGRIDATVDLVLDLIENGKRPVVFAYFKESLHRLRDGLTEKGLRVAYIDGDVTRPQRDAIRQDFVAGKYQVLVGQTEAAGVGINLHEASDTTVTHELTYRPIDVIQTEGRVHRLGIVNPTNHYYCLGAKTLDGHILEALQRKIAAKEAIDGNVEDDVIRSFFSRKGIL